MDVAEERTRRALACIGVAALGTLVAGVVYLRPNLAPPVATTPADSARVAVSGSTWRLVSASFGDADHGIVVFSPGPAPTTTFLTSDGGKTWRLAVRAPTNGYVTAVFLDTRTVVAQTVSSLGPANPGPVETRISRDAGRTWRRLADPRHNPGLGWLPAFLDTQHGWWMDRASSPDPRTAVTIWWTSDGGRSWHELVASGLPASGFPGQPVFTDPLHGALLFSSPDGTESAVATIDGGESWRAIKAPEVPVQATRFQNRVLLRYGHRLLSWLVSVPPAVSVVSGSVVVQQGGAIDYMPFVSLSDDGGQTWSQPRPAPDIVQPRYVSSPYPSLDDRERLLLLDDRRLWISEDDGATWAARLMQVPAELRLARLVSAVPGALYAMAAETGPRDIMTLTTPLTLIRSTDGGAHWSVVALPRPPAP